MGSRIQLISANDVSAIEGAVYLALKEITGKDPAVSPATQAPLKNCCQVMANAGTSALLVQRRVQDPDFSAEFAAYYSRQFADVGKSCTRVHFFKSGALAGETELAFLDRITPEEYLGFVTLRPVIKSPVGASIIDSRVSGGFVRSDDVFSVHIAGKQFSVKGTPFMQQDNAVGACAQASIWMALRTLRKREGDRAHDPAQITDAATRYYVTGRTRPNRGGLTQQQMTEAIRAAGYSPHLIPLGGLWYTQGQAAMTDVQIADAMRAIHPYIESQIPVVLILYPPSGGHAIVVIGHTWDIAPAKTKPVSIKTSAGTILSFTHAVSWTPSFIVHNDNSGPYRFLEERSANDYSMQHGASAIPLLPTDVFMSAEEASALALELMANVFEGFVNAKLMTTSEMQALTESLVVRLSLVDKRRLRKWAATNNVAVELHDELRLMDLPKRLWVFELHKAANYGTHGDALEKTMVVLVLIDSTGDDLASSLMLMHINLPELFAGFGNGALVKWKANTGVPEAGIKTVEHGCAPPIC